MSDVWRSVMEKGYGLSNVLVLPELFSAGLAVKAASLFSMFGLPG